MAQHTQATGAQFAELDQLALGMSNVAFSEPWYGVYGEPVTKDGPQFDQLLVIFKDADSADEYADLRPFRCYVRAFLLSEMPGYIVPGTAESVG